MAWAFLAAAILLEITATLSLRALATGWQLLPGVLVVLGYTGAFALMALALRRIDVGAAYAIWSGVGTAGVAVAAAALFGERITATSVIGILLVVAGVVVLSAGGAQHA